MTSPAFGIAYMFWLRLRWVAGAVLLSIAILAVIALLFPDSAVYCCAVVALPFSATLFFLNVFSLGPADLGVKSSGFPTHMRILPVSTRALVGWPMLFAAVTFVLLWVLPVALIFMPAGFPLPLLWPAAMFVALCLWVQAIGWSPFSTPFARVPMLIVALGPMLLPLGLGLTFCEGPLLAIVLTTCCVVWSFAAYWFGVAGLSRARAGSEGDWFGRITEWWNCRVADRFAASKASRPFRSAFAAQLWHECRRNAIVLPAMTALVGLPMLLVLLVPVLSAEPPANIAIGSTQLSSSALVLIGWAFFPMMFALSMGGGMAKCDIWGKAAMPSFFATRPVTTSRFVSTKLLATAISVALAWGVSLGLFAVWATIEASRLNMHPSIVRALLDDGTPRTFAICGLTFFAIVAMTWRNVMSGMWPTLTGRKNLANGIGFGFLSVWALIGIAAVIVYQHPAYHPMLWRLVPWVIAAEVALKLAAAIWLSWLLQRRGLVSPSTIGLLAIAWLVVAACILGGLSAFISLTWTIAAIVVLMVPFPSLAAAPLALDWNRHR